MGSSVAISGDTVMAGAPKGISGGPLMTGLMGTSPIDKVWVFTRAGGAWSQTQVLEPATGSDGGFGMSIALAADESVVGVLPARPWVRTWHRAPRTSMRAPAARGAVGEKLTRATAPPATRSELCDRALRRRSGRH